MPALAQRRFRSRSVGPWRGSSLPHHRLFLSADESNEQASYWIGEWLDPDETEVQLKTTYWELSEIFLEHVQHVQVWRRPDYIDIRSYSLPVSESFQNALREYTTISVDPDVMGGAPCIAGTRIPVYMVLDAVGYYGSAEGVLESYPNLTLDQVKDAIGFAKVVVECPLADNEP